MQRAPNTFPTSRGRRFRKQLATNNLRQTRCGCSSRRSLCPDSGLAWPADIFALLDRRVAERRRYLSLWRSALRSDRP
jgi:hypothetical protein